MRETKIGEFEELVLLIALILQDNAYVVNIKQELYNQVGRNVAMGALHPTLTRLENKGFLTSEMTGATKERGGRRKRVYTLTTAGKTILHEVKSTRANLWNQVPHFELT
ncbi:MAG: helix-turn-helix transcriptional regulator [Cyclobacteriaceae bacterium]